MRRIVAGRQMGGPGHRRASRAEAKAHDGVKAAGAAPRAARPPRRRCMRSPSPPLRCQTSRGGRRCADEHSRCRLATHIPQRRATPTDTTAPLQLWTALRSSLSEASAYDDAFYRGPTECGHPRQRACPWQVASCLSSTRDPYTH